MPLDAPPRRTAVWDSDLGFILLGVILERIGDAGLAAQVAPLLRALTDCAARLPAARRVAREDCVHWVGCVAAARADWRRTRRERVGQMDGVAAHAGLFGTAGAVGDVGRAVLRALRGASVDGLASPDTVRRFATRRTDVPETTRALGWDTMKASSSCGRFMSATAIGHTGFTGTSLWIDDVRDAYVVLLTNRVATPATGDAIRALRQAVHDAVFGPST